LRAATPLISYTYDAFGQRLVKTIWHAATNRQLSR